VVKKGRFDSPQGRLRETLQALGVGGSILDT
jgi:hypothetical protein